MRKIIGITIAVYLATAGAVQAHSVWINAFKSKAHTPPHVLFSLGWGHALPMDDMLNSPNGRIVIQKIEMVDPSLKRTPLILPKSGVIKPTRSTKNIDIFPGELALQKIAFKKDSAQGVYQFAMSSKPSFYTYYISKKGKERMQLKAKDQLNDIAKVLMAVKFEAFAKSYVTLGKWTKPKPLGHGLEIIPRTDLSDVHVGDLVEVDVLFYGKPLSATAKSMNFITAHGSSFGQNDGFSLFSYLIEGKAQFRVQSSGQWIISVNHKDDVTEDGPLKDLIGKAEQVYHSASLTLMVK